MSKLEMGLEKLIIFNKNAFVPFLVLSIFLTYFFSITGFSEEHYRIIHALFIGSIGLTIAVTGYFRIIRTLLMTSVIYAGYLVINNLRYIYGEDYVFSAGYNIWCALQLPDMLLAYFIFKKKDNDRYWSWFYVFLLVQTAGIERLPDYELVKDSYHFYKHIGMFNYPALYISVISMLILFIYHIRQGRILSAATFFSSLALFMGIYFSDNLFALCLFFWAAVLILLLATTYYVYYIRSHDEELDMENWHACFRESENKYKYPRIYSIAVMYIDGYDRLQKRFGYHKMLLLKKMFLAQIKKADKDVLIYNYKKDAFILAFKNENAAKSFIRAENIRRILAKSIFIFNENNHLQLTVSQCVSERKHNDANAETVLKRAETNLQKACKFTRNITVKA